MTKNIAVIRGDGIGPEIVNEALRVLDKIAELYGHTFHYTDVDMGGCAIDKWGDPLPQEMLDKCVASDSVHRFHHRARAHRRHLFWRA